MGEGDKMTGKQAKEQLIKLQSLCDGDWEANHVEADKILCDLLDSIGYDDIVNEWKKIGKWYA